MNCVLTNKINNDTDLNKKKVKRINKDDESINGYNNDKGI